MEITINEKIVKIISKENWKYDEVDFKKIESIADEIGVKLNSETIKAGKFFRDLENKLK